MLVVRSVVDRKLDQPPDLVEVAAFGCHIGGHLGSV
jgi:hypothetical protein